MRIVLVIALFVGFFLNLGSPPLFDRDEGAFSEATREMVASGDWISPVLNGEPRYDKPILIYWAQAPWVMLLGPTEWAFRLPSAIAGLLWVLVVVRFARPRLGGVEALLAGVVMATSVGFMMLARAAIADALLNLWLTLAMIEMWGWIGSPQRARLTRVHLWIALGMLTKGPVAVLVPAGVSLLYFGLRRDLLAWLRCVLYPPGLLVFVAVAAPWYVAQFARDGSDFFQGFFLRHNVERFSSPLEGHGGGLLYYVPVVLLATVPFAGFLTRVIVRARQTWRDNLGRFLWCWFLFVFVFFSLSGTKLPHYVMLGATPLVLLLAREIRRASSWAEVGIAPVLFWVAALLLPQAVGSIRSRIEDDYFVDVLGEASQVFDWQWTAAASAAILATIIAVIIWRAEKWKATVAIGIVHALILVTVVVPAVGELLQAPVKEAATLARSLDEPTVCYGVDLPSVSVYRRSLTTTRVPARGELAITELAKLEALQSEIGESVEVLYSRGGVVLVRRAK